MNIADPDQAVALDAVPDQPVLHAEIHRVRRYPEDLIDQLIVALEAALLRHLYHLKISDGGFDDDAAAADVVQLDEPEARVAVFHIRIVGRADRSVAHGVIVGGVFLSQLRHTFGDGLAETDAQKTVIPSHKRDDADASLQFLPEIEDHGGTRIHDANARLVKADLQVFFPFQFVRAGDIAVRFHHARRINIFFDHSHDCFSFFLSLNILSFRRRFVKSFGLFTRINRGIFTNYDKKS